MKMPKYTQAFTDRHGRPRFYFRRKGFARIRLPGLPWSPEFMAAYQAAMAGQARSLSSMTSEVVRALRCRMENEPQRAVG